MLHARQHICDELGIEQTRRRRVFSGFKAKVERKWRIIGTGKKADSWERGREKKD